MSEVPDLDALREHILGALQDANDYNLSYERTADLILGTVLYLLRPAPTGGRTLNENGEA